MLLQSISSIYHFVIIIFYSIHDPSHFSISSIHPSLRHHRFPFHPSLFSISSIRHFSLSSSFSIPSITQFHLFHLSICHFVITISIITFHFVYPSLTSSSSFSIPSITQFHLFHPSICHFVITV